MDSGISAAEQDSEVELQLDNFAFSLAETCRRVVNPERGETKKDGILFLFDECDNAIPALRLGYFFKTITEALLRQTCENVMFVIAGLPDTPEKLSKSHESSVRIFTQLKITELSVADRKYVVDKGIEVGNKINEASIYLGRCAQSDRNALRGLSALHSTIRVLGLRCQLGR